MTGRPCLDPFPFRGHATLAQADAIVLDVVRNNFRTRDLLATAGAYGMTSRELAGFLARNGLHLIIDGARSKRREHLAAPFRRIAEQVQAGMVQGEGRAA